MREREVVLMDMIKSKKYFRNEIKLKAPLIIRKKLNTVSFCYLLFAKTKEQI